VPALTSALFREYPPTTLGIIPLSGVRIPGKAKAYGAAVMRCRGAKSTPFTVT
jgi:hypothetical protein